MDQIRIAMWSGPRNISTTMMRSFSSRSDTFVSDEPFYACYLQRTGLQHPGREEILRSCKRDYRSIINDITSTIPSGKKVWYQKHMAHHLINLEKIEWIRDFYNCFLIRHPKNVINSYVKKNKLNHINELGYPQQYELIQYLQKFQKKILVIDTSILLKNPENILNQWCKHLDIRFDKRMLQWEKGLYPTDGIWWKHWYNNVINTTKFEIFQNQYDNVPEEYQSIYDEALYYYKKLYYFVL